MTASPTQPSVIVADYEDYDRAVRAVRSLDAIGVNRKRIAVASVAAEDAGIPASANAAWDAQVMRSIFQRFIAGAGSGVAVALTVLMMAVGCARLAGVDTSSWLGPAAIACGVAGFEIGGATLAITALPSMTDIGAEAPRLSEHTRLMVRLDDVKEEPQRLARVLAVMRPGEAMQTATPRHAA
jgi:hypothetical protein